MIGLNLADLRYLVDIGYITFSEILLADGFTLSEFSEYCAVANVWTVKQAARRVEASY